MVWKSILLQEDHMFNTVTSGGNRKSASYYMYQNFVCGKHPSGAVTYTRDTVYQGRNWCICQQFSQAISCCCNKGVNKRVRSDTVGGE